MWAAIAPAAFRYLARQELGWDISALKQRSMQLYRQMVSRTPDIGSMMKNPLRVCPTGGMLAPLVGAVVPVVLEIDRIENKVIMDVVPVYVGGEDELILTAQDLPRQLHADPVGLLRRHLARFKRLDQVAAQVRTFVNLSLIHI